MSKKEKVKSKPVQPKAAGGKGKPFFDREMAWWTCLSLGVFLVYYCIIRYLYPLPGFFPDSFTYVQAASDNVEISYRPVEYSKFIRFFKMFSDSDAALIFFQCLSIQVANTFLFLTIRHLFNLSKPASIVYFVLVLCNPLFALLGNMVLSDAFFASFVIVWFSLFLWVIHRPNGWFLLASIPFLALAFEIRYQAIVLPVLLIGFVFLFRMALWKKLVFIGVNFLFVLMIINRATNIVESETGVRTFSAFSGWQLANNAMHIYYNDRSVAHTSGDPEMDDIAGFMKTFFDSTTTEKPFSGISTDPMWKPQGALKQYLFYYMRKNNANSYFIAWNELGPLYSAFGKKVILENPGKYIQYFVIPNLKSYFQFIPEALDVYRAYVDRIPEVVMKYYGYTVDVKTIKNHPGVFNWFIKSWAWLFPLLNIAFVLLTALLFVRFKRSGILPHMQRSLVFTYVFILGNTGFLVLLAPITFRYLIYLIPILVLFSILMVQQLVEAGIKKKADHF